MVFAVDDGDRKIHKPKSAFQLLCLGAERPGLKVCPGSLRRAANRSLIREAEREASSKQTVQIGYGVFSSEIHGR